MIRPGQTFEDWIVEGTLRDGGSGGVWHVMNVSSGQMALLRTIGSYAEDVDEFARLADDLCEPKHPTFPKTLDSGTAADMVWAVFEGARQDTIRSALTDDSIDPEEAIFALIAVAEGLVVLHDQGHVHGAIAGESIGLGVPPRLNGLGLNLELVLVDIKQRRRHDVFALGRILAEVVDSADEDILFYPSLTAFVSEASHRDVERRPQTALEFLTGLREACSSGIVRQMGVFEQPFVRPALLLMAVGTVFAVGMIGAFLFAGDLSVPPPERDPVAEIPADIPKAAVVAPPVLAPGPSPKRTPKRTELPRDIPIISGRTVVIEAPDVEEPVAAPAKKVWPIPDGPHRIVSFLSRPAGAMVILDGAELGHTPLRDVPVAFGKHKLRMQRIDGVGTTETIRVGKKTSAKWMWSGGTDIDAFGQ